MAAVMVSRDPVADAFEDAERRLEAWGESCRRNSERLGLPRSSGIARMIEQVKVHEQLRKGVRSVTADGKQKRSMRPPSVQVQASVMEMDYIVAQLPNWMSKVVQRTYLWRQPHRIAARQMKIPKDLYTARWKAAVQYVAERLESKR